MAELREVLDIDRTAFGADEAAAPGRLAGRFDDRIDHIVGLAAISLRCECHGTRGCRIDVDDLVDHLVRE